MTNLATAKVGLTIYNRKEDITRGENERFCIYDSETEMVLGKDLLWHKDITKAFLCNYDQAKDGVNQRSHPRFKIASLSWAGIEEKVIC